MKDISLTPEQLTLLFSILSKRHDKLVAKAAIAASKGDHYTHDMLADEYWNLGQIIKQLDNE